MTVAIVWNTVAIRNPNEFPLKPKIVDSSTCAATDPPYEFTLMDAVLGRNEKKSAKLVEAHIRRTAEVLIKDFLDLGADKN